MANLLMIAMIPAIGEELLFRGVLQRLLSDALKNKHIAIFISAALFSAFKTFQSCSSFHKNIPFNPEANNKVNTWQRILKQTIPIKSFTTG